MPREAAVQLEASHLDPEAGLRRIEEWVRKAAAEGAEIIVFPELLVPVPPRYVPDPVPGERGGVPRLGGGALPPRLRRGLAGDPRPVHRAARRDRAERRRDSRPRRLRARPEGPRPLWNTGVVVDDQGNHLGKHRKLVGVMHERLIFDRGTAEDIRTFEAPQANLGVCICFENLQPLFRRSLDRLGEEIHCALWTEPAPRELAAERRPLERREAPGVTHALDTGTFVAISSQSQSGYGRELCAETLLEYSAPKAISMRIDTERPPMWGDA